IPVLNERMPRIAGTAGNSPGPDVVRRNGCHPIKIVVTGIIVWAGDDAPVGAIPVFDQRVLSRTTAAATARDPVSPCPDTVRGDDRHSKKEVVCFSSDVQLVRTGNDAPGGTIPVFDQRLVETLCGGEVVSP